MVDTRDLRDPQKLGERLLSIADHGDLSVRAVADRLPRNAVPNYPQDESTATLTARAYRAELEARTDKYAKSALEALDKGLHVEYDDPADG